MFRVVMLLAVVNDALIGKQNDVRVAVIENLLAISRIPAMMRRYKECRFPQALAKGLTLHKFFPNPHAPGRQESLFRCPDTREMSQD